jgi:hypothetical protein
MTVFKFIPRVFLFLFLISWIVAGCNSTPVPPTATPIPTFTATPSPTPTLPPTLEPPSDTGWRWLRPGLERRLIKIYNDQNQQVESLYVFRLDQNQFRLDVGYHETPQTLESWQRETGALLVVNGGYFRIENEKYIPDGLIIVNGEKLGSSYESFAGMLAINDHEAELRWLIDKPSDPYEPCLSNREVYLVFLSDTRTIYRRDGLSLGRIGMVESSLSLRPRDILHCIG